MKEDKKLKKCCQESILESIFYLCKKIGYMYCMIPILIALKRLLSSETLFLPINISMGWMILFIVFPIGFSFYQLFFLKHRYLLFSKWVGVLFAIIIGTGWYLFKHTFVYQNNVPVLSIPFAFLALFCLTWVLLSHIGYLYACHKKSFM